VAYDEIIMNSSARSQGNHSTICRLTLPPTPLGGPPDCRRYRYLQTTLARDRYLCGFVQKSGTPESTGSTLSPERARRGFRMPNPSWYPYLEDPGKLNRLEAW